MAERQTVSRVWAVGRSKSAKTITPLVVGSSLAVLLCVANVYLASGTGFTVGATAPAALVLLWVARGLRGFGMGSREQNLARTLATTGEIIAAGVIFSLPAYFGVLERKHDSVALVLMVLVGGVLGVATAVLLRRSVLRQRTLEFPEAEAAAQVMSAGSSLSPWHTVVGAAAGAVAPVAKRLFGVSPTTKPGGFQGPLASAAVLGLGYFIGHQAALQALFGSLLLVIMMSTNAGSAHGLEPAKVGRAIAVGCLIGGSFLMCLELIGKSLSKLRRDQPPRTIDVDRGVRDLEPTRGGIVGFSIVLAGLGFFGALWFTLHPAFGFPPIGWTPFWVIPAAMLASGISCFVVGLVGSSLNPISALAFLVSLVSLAALQVAGLTDGALAVAAFGAGISCIAAGVAGNLMQDFRVGQAINAAPQRIAIFQLAGVVLIAGVMPVIYGGFVPDDWIKKNLLLQASAMVDLLRQAAEQKRYLLIGGLLSIAVWTTRRLQPAVVGIGMFLPVSTTLTLALGGVVKWAHQTWFRNRVLEKDEALWRLSCGTVVVCGFIVGEGLAEWVLLLTVAGSSTSASLWFGTTLLSGLAVYLFVVPLLAQFRPDRRLAASSAIFIIEPTFHGSRYPATAATIADRVVVIRRRHGPGSPGDLAEELIVHDDTPEVVCAAVRGRLERWEVASAGILPGNDYCVPLAAEVASRMGWIGNPIRAAQAVRNKSTMRRAFEQAGVPSPRSFSCVSVKAAVAAFSQLGGRAVVKPPDMTGSLFVRQVEDAKALVAHTRRILGRTRNLGAAPVVKEVLVEQLVTGDEFSVELFIHRKEVAFVSVTEKQKWVDSPFFVERQHVVPSSSTTTEQDDLIQRTARAAVEALSIENGPVHAEIMLSNDGEPYVIEVAARVAGDEITKLLRLAGEVDLHAAAVRQALGKPPFLRTLGGLRRGASIHFLSAPPGIVQSVAGLDDARRSVGVKYVTISVGAGDVVHPLTSSMQRVGYVVAVGDESEYIKQSAAQAKERATEAAAMIRIETS